jgi:xanthine dehydrogenase small subunit
MKSNIKEFHFPTETKEAALLLAKLRSKGAIVGGSTRLPRAMAPSVEAVVDISDLPLKYIKADKSGLRIGALCTLADLERSPLVQKWAGGVIAKSAAIATTALARSMGTVGGNIVRAYPYNNLPPVFLALGAQVVYTDGKRERVVPFAEILKPEAMRDLGTRHLLTEVRLPGETRTWSSVMERIASLKTDWVATAICAVAVEKKDGLCRKASIALGCVVPRATRFEKAEKLLEGHDCTEAKAKAAADAVVAELPRLSTYERAVTGVLVRRSLLEAFKS